MQSGGEPHLYFSLQITKCLRSHDTIETLINFIGQTLQTEGKFIYQVSSSILAQ